MLAAAQLPFKHLHSHQRGTLGAGDQALHPHAVGPQCTQPAGALTWHPRELYAWTSWGKYEGVNIRVINFMQFPQPESEHDFLISLANTSWKKKMRQIARELYFKHNRHRHVSKMYWLLTQFQNYLCSSICFYLVRGTSFRWWGHSLCNVFGSFRETS